MKFCEKLNEYLALLDCTAKDISDISGISPATISRYKSGERVPESDSEAFSGLCRAVAGIAEKQESPDITYEKVKSEFLACEDVVFGDKELLRQNFNALITAMDININRLCRYANYDASTVFRIRNGTRKPADIKHFAESVAAFTAKEKQSPAELMALAELIGCKTEEIAETGARSERLRDWLLAGKPSKDKPDNIENFLNKLDEFDLNEYIKAIKFNELKVPSVPFQMPASKTYFGLKEMMESELDFLKATVLSKSTEPVTMYSDMPMEEMAKDAEFPKKWMFGMAMLLKKGLRLNQIHNLDRSFEDMMLGLESWIPMYMTGQISPYYFKNIQNNVFLHFLKVSGAAALSGEAVAGHHSGGKYYLTNSKKELVYYTARANDLLSNAYPLMDIYRSERENELNAFLLADSAKLGKRRSILSTLPLYTASDALLKQIMDNNGVPESEQADILKYAAAKRGRIENALTNGIVEDDISEIDDAEFALRPPTLEISGAFCERDIKYSPSEYREHLKQTEEFAAAHSSYILKKSPVHAFRNLQIFIREDQWVMISKGKAPAIHFVIRHPKLRAAIESFIPPITEE